MYLRAFIPSKQRAAIGRTLRNLKRRTKRGRIGCDFPDDVKSRLASHPVRTVFDVGAHIGMSALEFSDAFPSAIIHAFEPSAENVKALHRNLPNKPLVIPYKMALGAYSGPEQFHYNAAHPSMSRLSSDGLEAVVVQRLDAFCREHSIDRIDILKIDTEGHELPVLQGAEQLLADHKILLIKAECTCDPLNTYHTQFSELFTYLNKFGYRIFGFYDQASDKTPHLGWFDAAFIAPAKRG
jgi:FkbM family methyltransferase